MGTSVDAIYEGGVLRPLSDLALPEHSLVKVTVDASLQLDDPASAVPDPGIDVLTHEQVRDLLAAGGHGLTESLLAVREEERF